MWLLAARGKAGKGGRAGGRATGRGVHPWSTGGACACVPMCVRVPHPAVQLERARKNARWRRGRSARSGARGVLECGRGSGLRLGAGEGGKEVSSPESGAGAPQAAPLNFAVGVVPACACLRGAPNP